MGKFRSMIIMALAMGCFFTSSVNAKEISNLVSKNLISVEYQCNEDQKKKSKNEFSLGYFPFKLKVGEGVQVDTIKAGLRTHIGEMGPLEILAGMNFFNVTSGPGSYIVSGDLYVRYPFNIENLNLSSYVQMGRGVAFNDIYKYLNQDVIGQEVVFNGSLALGFKPKDENWGIELEFEHQSWGSSFLSQWANDGGKPDRDVGRNAVGFNVVYRF